MHIIPAIAPVTPGMATVLLLTKTPYSAQMKQFIKSATKGTGDKDPTEEVRLIPRAILKLEPCIPMFINGPNVDNAAATPGGTAKVDPEVIEALTLIVSSLKF